MPTVSSFVSETLRIVDAFACVTNAAPPPPPPPPPMVRPLARTATSVERVVLADAGSQNPWSLNDVPDPKTLENDSSTSLRFSSAVWYVSAGMSESVRSPPCCVNASRTASPRRPPPPRRAYHKTATAAVARTAELSAAPPAGPSAHRNM